VRSEQSKIRNQISKIVSTAFPRDQGRRAHWYLGGYWLLLVLATHWPNPWSSGSGPRYPDKLVHLAAYTVLAFLVVPVVRRLTTGNKDRVRVAHVISWVAVAAIGLLDEATQPLTGRDFEWLDWLADSAGAACGLALGRAWFRDRTSLMDRSP